MSIIIRGVEMPKSCQECRFMLPEMSREYFCFASRKIMRYGNVEVFNPCKHKYKDCPLVEVSEQKHGKWMKAYLDHESFGVRPTVVYCSECNLVGYWEPNYCPNCGARMDGE